jgi:glycosyltransferase involved in cell wall biosynthesis
MPDFDPSTLYSVMLTVYRGDKPTELEAAVESCLDQTYPPAELLLVADGPLTDALQELVDSYVARHPDVVRLHQLAENRGRGAAARKGIEECTHDFVGVMSSDDICVPDRFECQVAFLDAHPEVDAVGGYIAEFTENPTDIDRVRKVPTDPDAVERVATYRSPMNEVTVTFRREAVLSAGNYRPLDRMEDYDLWVRMIQDDATLTNLDTVLVKVRGGKAMLGRRGGFEYAREDLRQQREFLNSGFIGLPRFLLNLSIRVPLRLVPNAVRSVIYRRFARSKQ